MNGDQRRPPPTLFKVINPIVRPLLRSPLHGLLSNQLMLLTYTGRLSGRERTIPIGYFAWEAGTVISFSSARWGVNLQDGRSMVEESITRFATEIAPAARSFTTSRRMPD